jgi:hypothetical protein
MAEEEKGDPGYGPFTPLPPEKQVYHTVPGSTYKFDGNPEGRGKALEAPDYKIPAALTPPPPVGKGLDDDVKEELRKGALLDEALAKYDTSSLAVKPGDNDNWIEAVGGKLPSFVRAVAHALMRERGFPRSQAIQVAIGQMKNWASGRGDVTAKTRAKAAKAVAEWTALKAKAAAK